MSAAPAEELTGQLQAMIDTLRAAAVVQGVIPFGPHWRPAGESALVRRSRDLRHQALLLQTTSEAVMANVRCAGGPKQSAHHGTSTVAEPPPAPHPSASIDHGPPDDDAPLVTVAPTPTAGASKVIRKHVAPAPKVTSGGDDDFLVRFDRGNESSTPEQPAAPAAPAPAEVVPAAPEVASYVHQAVQPIVEIGSGPEKDFTSPSLHTFAAAVRATDIALDELVPTPVRTVPFPDEDDSWLSEAESHADTVMVASLDSRDYILSEPTDRIVIRPGSGRRRPQTADADEAAPDPAEVQSWLRRAQERTTMAPLEAIELYTDVLDVLPGHLDARLARARLFTDGGQLARAASDLLRAERLAPHHPDLHHCYGDVLFRDKSYEMAIPHYSKVLRQHHNSIMALYRRGLCYYYARNHTRARQDLQRVRTLDPTLPGLETSLAQLDGDV